MSSRAEYYRSRGLEAQQRAAQTNEEKIRDAFENVAEGWFVLAEQMDWLDRERNAPELVHTRRRRKTR
jgi:hypothetical protein